MINTPLIDLLKQESALRYKLEVRVLGIGTDRSAGETKN